MHLIPKPVLVSGPTEDAVSLATVKEFLRIDGTADDTALGVIISGCTKRVEQFIDRKLVTQTWDVFYDDFPYTEADVWWDGVREGSQSELRKPAKYMELPFGPLQSVTYFYSYGEDDVAVDFSTANWQADLKGPAPRIVLKMGGAWPTTILRPVNGVQIRGVFGFGAAAAVPDDIKQGLLSFIAKTYEHRGDELPIIPVAAQMLLEPYRRVKVG